MTSEQFVGSRPHPVLAAMSGLTIAVLASASFWGGFIVGQNPPAPRVVSAAPATSAAPAAQPAVGQSGMSSMAAMSASSSVPTLDAVARAAGAGKTYPA